MRTPRIVFWNTVLWILLFGVFIAAFGFLMACSKKEVRTDKEPMPQIVVLEEAAAPVAMYSKMAAATEPARVPEFNTEEYDRIYENVFKKVITDPVSTFSIDVDTASYSNVRRFLKYDEMPPKDAVRIEEMINYFNYDYPDPEGTHPFSITTEISNCPWNGENYVLHVGLKGKPIDYEDIRPSNLVFLIDSSGSMSDSNKLPLVKKSFELMLDKLQPDDRVAIVAYAGSAGLVLPSTPASQKERILAGLSQLNAGGATAGGAGIELAYKVASDNMMQNGNNRVILVTDGDFNVGTSSTGDLVRMIEDKRKLGIYLTLCGFGMGNYKDARMEQISNAGNGNYFYIDNILEAKKVFVTELRANLFTIAKDVKIQIEFNPAKVAAYRLIGYENRVMAREDFADDTKDAGELGAGHTVTALYELKMADTADGNEDAGELRYQASTIKPDALQSDELLTIQLRYKPPGQEQSRLLALPVKEAYIQPPTSTSDNFRWSCAVAALGMLLRESEYIGDYDYENVLSLAKTARGNDENGYRAEFIRLVEKSMLLSGKPKK